MANFKVKKIVFLISIVLFICTYGVFAKAAIDIVSAENVYGEVAKELGGPYVNVTNILNNPNQDPHLFTIRPSTALAVTKAKIIIYNGADYDSWMKSLLTIKGQQNKRIIVVAELMNIKSGDNPHIWYMPETIPTFAQNLVNVLTQIDPLHHDYFQQQLKNFHHEYKAIFETINLMKQKFQNTPVIATEPVFNYMANTIGLRMYGEDFQLSIMNDVPPTISQIKQFEDALRHHSVRALIFNSQVINPAAQRMLLIAQDEKIPVVGVNEMLPNDTTYVQWILKQLTALKIGLEKNEH